MPLPPAPSGFAWANHLQVLEWEAQDGRIIGAVKLHLDGMGHLAVRLGPPRFLRNIRSEARHHHDSAREYANQYQQGWIHARRGGGLPEAASAAFEDGWTDRRSERPKWHLTYCTDHNTCGA